MRSTVPFRPSRGEFAPQVAYRDAMFLDIEQFEVDGG